MKIRKQLKWFVIKMEEAFKNNGSEDAPGKGRMSNLQNKLMEEVHELDKILWQSDSSRLIISKCADVANFAMMMANIVNEENKKFEKEFNDILKEYKDPCALGEE